MNTSLIDGMIFDVGNDDFNVNFDDKGDIQSKFSKNH